MYYYLKEFKKPDFDKSRPIAFDTETAIPRNSKSKRKTLALYGETRLVQIAQDGVCYVYDTYYIDIKVIKDYLSDTHLYAHNIIYDLSCPDFKNWQPKSFDCTLYLLRQHVPELDSFSLKSGLEYFNIGKKTDEGASDWSITELSQSQLKYAANDVIYLEEMYNRLKERPFSYRLDIKNLSYSLKYQNNGFKVHESNRRKAITKAKEKEKELQKDLGTLNVNSPKQVCEFINTKSSSAEVLSDLALKGNKKAERVLALRKAKKQLSFLEDKFSFDRVYGIFNPAGAKSGRFTCKGNGHTKASQNLQQLPYQLKYVFGYEEEDIYLVDADYTALEIHTAACMMGETKMTDIMKDRGDLHYSTASLIYDKPISEVTTHERKMGKGLNFSLLYGAGPGVAQIFLKQIAGLNVPLDEVKVFRQKWLDAYPAIKAYHKRIGDKFDSSMIVQTPLGKKVRANSYTEAINVPCQGAGAECTKLAIHYLYQEIPDVKLVNTVHDSITLEVRGLKEAKRQAKILKECLDKSWLTISPYLEITDLTMDNVAEVTKVYEGEAVWSTTKS